MCLDTLCTNCLFSSETMSVPYKLVVDGFDLNCFTPLGGLTLPLALNVLINS